MWDRALFPEGHLCRGRVADAEGVTAGDDHRPWKGNDDGQAVRAVFEESSNKSNLNLS